MSSACDVLVVGGGICGLWTLWKLRHAGYNAWLIESSALGNGQTIASQGILHAGAKYDRLPGQALDAAQSVADVQPIWRRALEGGGDGIPDLSTASMIDSRTILWTRRTLGSAAAAMGARRVMRSEVRKLSREAWPAGFRGAPRGIRVFETDEAVLEPRSLLASLSEACGARVRRGIVSSISSLEDGVRVTLSDGVVLDANTLVLCAGEGNEGLLELAGADASALMQRRPLHQLVAVGAPFDVNGHCLKLDLDKPELTVTTGELDGERSWYFGGGPAEEGVGQSPESQVDAGKRALERAMPWVDQSGLEWRVFEINRAEGRTPSRKRPSDAVAVWADGVGSSRVLAVWPTKLVLAPRAAEIVLEQVSTVGVTPSAEPDLNGGFMKLGTPGLAERVW